MSAGEFFIARLDASAPGFSEELARLRRPPEAADVSQRVAEIIARVRSGGDAALLELSASLDRAKFAGVADMLPPPGRMEAARRALSPELESALSEAAENIRAYHERQGKPRGWEYEDARGNMAGERAEPVAHAAVYAPGGLAAYPSSVLMGVIPAKVAGVPEVTLLTPPSGGSAAEATLAAAHIAGADRVVLAGGAQAVAAAALGTESVPKADVVAGPGNAYVTEAKRQLCGEIGVDSPAGPSEVFIIADGAAPAAWTAADMLAQAEHDALAQSMLASPSAAYLDEVEREMAAQAENAPRAATVLKSLSIRGALILASDLAACARIANEVAAEHVQVMCEDAEEVAAQVRCAGALFIGAHSCVALGDYGAGPNHVLPTAGAARFASPLGVHHFMRRMSVLRASPAGSARWARTAAVIADAEGLPAHAASLRLRADSAPPDSKV